MADHSGGWREHERAQRRAWLELTPAQRLRWLEQAKRFYRDALGAARREAARRKDSPGPPDGDDR